MADTTHRVFVATCGGAPYWVRPFVLVRKVPPDDVVPPNSILASSDSVTISSEARSIPSEAVPVSPGGQPLAREAVGGLIDITG